MATDRFVVLGLAQARSAWFREVGRWANAGSLPVEFAKCQSAEELRARLASGRPASAVLVDGALPALDRDLSEAITSAGCALIVVDDGPVRRDLAALGASAWLEPTFGPAELLDFLLAFAQPVRRAVDVPGSPSPEPVPLGTGRLFAVCGPGGTGASTTAIALAQGLVEGVEARRRGGRGGAPRPPRVVLADFCRHAEQAMLHDARDVLNGVQELAEAHRSARLQPEQTADLCVAVPSRGYHLLTGLRRAKSWPAVKPRAFGAALNGLRAAFDTVVADVDADFECEADTGSVDVEDRNTMGRQTVLAADAVLIVGRPDMKGVHALVRTIHEAATAGVHPARIVPVVTCAPRAAGAKAQLTSTVAELTSLAGGRPAPPIFLPERRVDEALRDGVPLPPPLAGLVTAGVDAALTHAPGLSIEGDGSEPRRVRPGSLGLAWTEPDDEAAGS